MILGWSFDFRLDFLVGYRLPGGYTVEWFWVDFYMWLLFDFWCLGHFGHLGLDLRFRFFSWIF